jgi:two-component system, OmpR family, alkaline phosphatase synthesis response regulator PhoP
MNGVTLAHPSDQPENKTVLVIDDEPYILRALKYLLNREGYVVETASNGEEGLARAREVKPAVVFLDVMMPRLNGHQVCEQMRQDPSFAGTYIIMLSAKGQQADREQGLAGGANEYLTKPFSPREISARLRDIFERAHAMALAPTRGS